MQLNSMVRTSRPLIPVLSVQSGQQLVNEVSQQSEAQLSTKQRRGTDCYSELKAKAQQNSGIVYEFSVAGLKPSPSSQKGIILNAVA